MVSKKTIKELDFLTIDDYFEYIIDSYINGQFTQVRSLIKKLSEDQKYCFRGFLNNYFIENRELKANILNLTFKTN